MIDIDMCSVSLGLKVVTDVLSMTLNALYMSLQVKSKVIMLKRHW